MASALLLWDNLRVIAPWESFPIAYHANDMAEAWELIGKVFVPDDANRQLAHKAIQEMIEGGALPQFQCPPDLRPDQEYEMYARKLSHDTWSLLSRNGLTGRRDAKGDYTLNQQAGMTIMAKLADACAGDAFARVTDRMLAYGLIADRDEPMLAQSHVVPLTLDLIDAGSITLERLIEFRRREERERRGGDYRAWRHNYADAIQAHVKRLKNVESANQRDELNNQFRDDMAGHLAELKLAIGVAKMELVLKPTVVSLVVGAGGFLTSGPIAAVAGLAAGPFLKSLTDMFTAGIGFSEKQRKAMDKNPMAYMYQLARA